MLDLEPIWQAETQQQNYRVLLEAMSRPGSRQALHGVTESSGATLAVLATLLDGSVSLSDLQGLLSEADRTLLQSVQADPEQADYLLCCGHQAPTFEPKLGSLPSPECSATLVVEVTSLNGGELHLNLSGPGIRERRECAVAGLDPDWLARRQSWVCGFPLGVDLILVDREQVMALPRTTRVEVR
ncbi:MAG: phosphonate C-P lyase system protein PhnH [Chromatiales bacterium]|jgi:alpha-D-ribose 1-methylphosphonate 5-triphosphate synthase subunit PhnH